MNRIRGLTLITAVALAGCSLNPASQVDVPPPYGVPLERASAEIVLKNDSDRQVEFELYDRSGFRMERELVPGNSIRFLTVDVHDQSQISTLVRAFSTDKQWEIQPPLLVGPGDGYAVIAKTFIRQSTHGTVLLNTNYWLERYDHAENYHFMGLEAVDVPEQWRVWWEEMEECMRFEANVDEPQFFVADRIRYVDGKKDYGILGYVDPEHDAIYIQKRMADQRWLVMHEAGHWIAFENDIVPPDDAEHGHTTIIERCAPTPEEYQ